MFLRYFVILLLLFSKLLLARDELIVAVPNPVTKLDPRKLITIQEHFSLPLVFESLFLKDLNGDISPLIAKKFEIFNNNEILLTINKLSFFSNGDRLKVEDVVNSLVDICKNPKLNFRLSSIKGCRLNKIVEVFKVNDSQLKIVSATSPLYTIEQLSSTSIAVFKILNNKFLGTGGYEINSYSKEYLSLVKNNYNNYSGSEIKKIKFIHIPDSEIKSNLSPSKFDVAAMYLSTSFENIKSNEFIRIDHSPQISLGLVLNSKHKLLKNKKLRNSLHQEFLKQDFRKCNREFQRSVGMIPEGVGGYIENDKLKLTNKTEFYRLKRKEEIVFYKHVERKSSCEEKIIKEIFAKHNINLKFSYIDSYAKLFPLYLDEKTPGYIELFVFTSPDASTLLKRFVKNNKVNIFHFTSKSIQKHLEHSSNQILLSNRIKDYQMINKEIFYNSIFFTIGTLGPSNLYSKCIQNDNKILTYYNPNSFLFLKNLKYKKGCSLKENL